MRLEPISDSSPLSGGFLPATQAYVEMTHLPHQQSRRGKASGVARLALSADKREQAIELSREGMKQKEIAVMLGVSDRTIRNWLSVKSGNEPISDSSPLSGSF